MKIDWSKAPAGTTHVAKCTDPKFNREFWCADIGDRYKDLKSEAYLRKEDVGRSGWLIYERPIPWTGEGLPPVGTVCLVADGYWADHPLVEKFVGKQVTIVAHDDLWAVFKMDVYPNECGPRTYAYHAMGAPAFRPIRTPEQIAADERESAIKEMVSACHYSGSECTKTDCAALYDAGYRKQAQP